MGDFRQPPLEVATGSPVLISEQDGEKVVEIMGRRGRRIELKRFSAK